MLVGVIYYDDGLACDYFVMWHDIVFVADVSLCSVDTSVWYIHTVIVVCTIESSVVYVTCIRIVVVGYMLWCVMLKLMVLCITLFMLIR